MLETILPVILIICVFVILFTGVFLFYRMLKTKLFNLFGLAMFFILYGIQFMGRFLFPFIFAALYSQLCLLFLIIFIKNTFYKDSKSFLPLIVIITFIVLKIFSTIIALLYNFKIPPSILINPSQFFIYYLYVTLIVLEVTIPSIWLACNALKIYRRLENYDIEPWVKKRYLLIAIPSLLFAASAIASYLMPLEGGFEATHPVVSIFVASSFIIFSFGNLIAWIMPKKLKKYYNRNYEVPISEELSEKDLLDKIKSQLSKGD